MAFKMEFKTNGEALMTGREDHLSAMLSKVAKDVVNGKKAGSVIDDNGNVLGEWSYTYDFTHGEPEADDDSWNDEDEDGNRTVWCNKFQEWYLYEDVRWDESEQDYLPK